MIMWSVILLVVVCILFGYFLDLRKPNLTDLPYMMFMTAVFICIIWALYEMIINRIAC